MTTSLPKLPLAIYRLRFELLEHATLPPFLGSTWRGLLGHALKQSVCITHQTQCDGCLLRQHCAYSYIFETPPPPNTEKMRRYTSAPHPFVISPLMHKDEPMQPGAFLVLNLTLIGKGNDYLSHVINAFYKAGELGIGQQRARFKLSDIEQRPTPTTGEWQTIIKDNQLIPLPASEISIPELSGDIRLQLIQPLKLRREGKNIKPEHFNFSDLFSNLLRRISMLQYFHTEHALETDFAALTQHAKQVKIGDAQLTWFDWQRYSNRHKDKIDMGGLKGEFTLPTEQLNPFWPYLWLGQWIYAGKGTVMGMGQYRISTKPKAF